MKVGLVDDDETEDPLLRLQLQDRDEFWMERYKLWRGQEKDRVVRVTLQDGHVVEYLVIF